MNRYCKYFIRGFFGYSKLENDSYQLWRRTGCLWQGAIVSCTSSCVDRHLGECNGKNLGRVGTSSCRKFSRKSDETDKWNFSQKSSPHKNAKKSPMPTHWTHPGRLTFLEPTAITHLRRENDLNQTSMIMEPMLIFRGVVRLVPSAIHSLLGYYLTTPVCWSQIPDLRRLDVHNHQSQKHLGSETPWHRSAKNGWVR